MNIKADSRMGWIRNINNLRKKPNNIIESEYELSSNELIYGMLNYRNELILCSLMTLEPDQKGLYKYDLKIKYPQAAFNYPNYIRNAHKKGYLFRDGIPGEIISLLSFYFQSRFYLTAGYHGELNSRSIKNKFEYYLIYPKAFHHIRKNSKIKKHMNDIVEFLDKIIRLPETYHQQVILACYHYARALREFGVDEEMVFIRLISSIEALLNETKLSRKDDPLRGIKIRNLISKEKLSGLSGNNLSQLESIFNVRLAKIKYIRFIEEYSKGFFRGGNYMARHTRILRVDLKRTLSSIYDARSSYLHKGQPMYLSIINRKENRWDTDPSLGMILDRRRFSGRCKLPYGDYFQNLVNFCINKYIDKKTS